MVKVAAAPLPTLSLHPPHAGVIPMLGLGTWPLTGRQAYETVRTALELGYRHLDTATAYGNEAEIGAALADAGIRREEVFLTTKLPASLTASQPVATLDSGGKYALPRIAAQTQAPQAFLEQSLTALELDWVDLWLLDGPLEAEPLLHTWQQMVQAQEQGLALGIGVSNLTPQLIDYLSTASGVTPAVHQVQWSPQRYQPELLRHARDNHIVLVGYSPFRHIDLDHPLLCALAQRYQVSTAQIVLRWHLDQDVVATPRSVRYEHLVANLEVTSFNLSPDEVEQLNGLTAPTATGEH